MSPETQRRVTWGAGIVAVIAFVALLAWFLMTPDDVPVAPPQPTEPCVCPTSELPPTLPETGKSL